MRTGMLGAPSMLFRRSFLKLASFFLMILFMDYTFGIAASNSLPACGWSWPTERYRAEGVSGKWSQSLCIKTTENLSYVRPSSYGSQWISLSFKPIWVEFPCTCKQNCLIYFLQQLFPWDDPWFAPFFPHDDSDRQYHHHFMAFALTVLLLLS